MISLLYPDLLHGDAARVISLRFSAKRGNEKKKKTKQNKKGKNMSNLPALMNIGSANESRARVKVVCYRISRCTSLNDENVPRRKKTSR